MNDSDFLKGVRDNGTVEGSDVETHYRPCKWLWFEDGYLRVVIEENGYDVETRITDDALRAAGYVRAVPGKPAVQENT